jgi:osmotically inducible protein OsmC
MQRMYTAEATAYGARTGAVVTSDEKLDLALSLPAGMGGDDGPGTNPEQLFAAGYAACFHSAMRHAVRELGLSQKVLEGSHVTARVTFLKEPPMEFGLEVELELSARGMDPEQALQVMEMTHQICPYSKATMGNIEVQLLVAQAAPVE